METMRNDELGLVVSVTGARAGVRLYKEVSEHANARVTIGRLVATNAGATRVVGVITRVSVSQPEPGVEGGGFILADVDFLGEIKHAGSAQAFFNRGVTDYPTIGDGMTPRTHGELGLIHHISAGETIEVGRLQLDDTIPAYINFEELLRKHFAILGTTGVGKSTSVALILQEILSKKANLRIFLID